jgi:hypothetical protein
LGSPGTVSEVSSSLGFYIKHIGKELSEFPRIIVPTSSGFSNPQIFLDNEDESSIILSNVSNYLPFYMV